MVYQMGVPLTPYKSWDDPPVVWTKNEKIWWISGLGLGSHFGIFRGGWPTEFEGSFLVVSENGTPKFV